MLFTLICRGVYMRIKLILVYSKWFSCTTNMILCIIFLEYDLAYLKTVKYLGGSSGTNVPDGRAGAAQLYHSEGHLHLLLPEVSWGTKMLHLAFSTLRRFPCFPLKITSEIISDIFRSSENLRKAGGLSRLASGSKMASTTRASNCQEPPLFYFIITLVPLSFSC